jgi:threonine/homoserine/homoserine lactone efflux protein
MQSLVSVSVSVYILRVMSLEFLAKGFLIGILVAAPLGPVGILVVHRVLAERRRAGFVSGIGAATADMLYACIAAWFFTYAARLLGGHPIPVRLIGGVVLCVLGVKLMRIRPHDANDPDQRGTLWSHFISTFFLTAANPITVFALSAIFAAWGPANEERTFVNMATLVGGIFAGSVAWFGAISLFVGLVRLHMTPERLRWVNILCGLSMLVFGIVVLVNMASLCCAGKGSL